MRKFASSNACRFFRHDGEEILFETARSPYVTDSKGRKYTDFILGCGPVILGHGNERFAQEMAEAMKYGFHLPGYGSLHEELAGEFLDELARPGQVGYFKHSSDSMTAAARLASNETGRLGVVRCGYLGWHDLLIGASPAWHEPLSSPHRAVVRPTGPMRGIGADEPIFDWVDLSLDTLRGHLKAHRGIYGTFMFDAHQLSFMSQETLVEAVVLAREFGCRFVADETKTAGRVSRLGLLHTIGIVGDYIVLGKAIANGAPSSLLIGPQNMQDSYGICKISGTHCKEMIGAHATKITSNLMAELDGYGQLGVIAKKLAQAFNQTARSMELGDSVWLKPLFNGSSFELCFSQALIHDRGARDCLVREMASEGILMMQGHPSFICLDHAAIDWDEFEVALASALKRWSPTALTIKNEQAGSV